MKAELLQAALARREELADRLEAEGTTAFRLFHGIAEGWPGLSVDRYGEHALAQTWREPLKAEDLALLQRALPYPLTWRHRGRERVQGPEPTPKTPFSELGVRYEAPLVHRGQDPWLFLDLRAGRRWLQANSAGRRVLNLFAYTGASGLVAACAGASEVLDVDHGGWPLRAAQELAELNGVAIETLKMDYFLATRQLAGLPVKGRAVRRGFQRLAPRQFDLVVLDPPTFTKGPFGAVDIVRDYPGLLKPALLTLAEGGQALVTNHSPKVSVEDFEAIVRNCARKAGRPLQRVERLHPEEDFPSVDGKPPLKVLALSL